MNHHWQETAGKANALEIFIGDKKRR